MPRTVSQRRHTTARHAPAADRASLFTPLPQADGLTLVLCSWDGSTFFFSRDGHAAQFLLCEEVTAFAVGNYGAANAPSLIYACMGEGLRVYSDIEIPSIAYVGRGQPVTAVLIPSPPHTNDFSCACLHLA